jgi:predicted nuclease of restriction endonuclease-like (RecB) superfamily
MENNRNSTLDKSFVADVKSILDEARSKSYATISTLMTNAYWHIGQRIVEQEQQGSNRAVYGKQMIETLSAELTKEYGKGYSVRYLRCFRQFFLEFPDFPIQQTRLPNLNWAHFLRIMRVENRDARTWYLNEAAANTWSIRTLDRNISTLYYERLLMSKKPAPVVSEMVEKTAAFQVDKYEFIKNPYVLEFLNLPTNSGYLESDLESALIEQLKKFMLELGKGFAFIESQQHIRTEANDYYIDLVFYNYLLKCFVIMDLKTTKISHQDVGQMDMYVRMFDELKRSEGDNPTIGIVLCAETDSDIARYSILNGNEQLFASKYKLFLPTEAELRAEIEREKRVFNLKNGMR